MQTLSSTKPTLGNADVSLTKNTMSDYQTNCAFDREPYVRDFRSTVLDVKGDLAALSDTFFYPAGGGQPGDCGTLRFNNLGEIRVLETFRDQQNRSCIWHRLASPVPPDVVGESVAGEIDWRIRYGNMQMHTCLHLLCSLISAPVTGCSMGGDKGRLDFDLPEMQFSKEEITLRLNEMIADRINVRTTLVSPEHRDSLLPLVRNRYALPPDTGDAIKMIEIEGVDVQPCGGTHVANTSEIRQVVCEKIEKKGRQNRRIVLRFIESGAEPDAR